MKIYYSTSTNPYLNIAIEKYLFDQKEEAFYFWVNEPSCILGRNQNPYQEINIDYATNNNIHIVRRFSGGGCVYHDLGNINFSYITKNENPEKIINYIKDILSQYQIKLNQSGRNDLLYDKYKVSGMAFVEDEGFLYHGTLLIDVNLEKLKQVLNPSQLKLEGHGISSVKSRVINLHQVHCEITVPRLFNQLISDQGISIEVTPHILNIQKKLQSKDWIYGQSPKYNLTLEKKLNDGCYTFQLEINDAIIQNIKIYTDSLFDKEFKDVEKKWQGKAFSLNHFLEDICSDLQDSEA